MSRLIMAGVILAIVAICYWLTSALTQPRRVVNTPMTNKQFVELYDKWEREGRTTLWVQAELLQLRKTGRLPAYFGTVELTDIHAAYVLASLEADDEEETPLESST